MDEAEIRHVLASYARGIDRLDWELIRRCYHPDATEDRGRYRGGVDGFIEWLQGTLTAMEATWHLVGIPMIEFEGDIAWVESYCLGAQYVSADDGEVRGNLVPCRYCDRFERRDGAWLIAARTAVYEPTMEGPQVAASGLGEASRRDRADVAYRR